jgi:hypothetical protein
MPVPDPRPAAHPDCGAAVSAHTPTQSPHTQEKIATSGRPRLRTCPHFLLRTASMTAPSPSPIRDPLPIPNTAPQFPKKNAAFGRPRLYASTKPIPDPLPIPIPARPRHNPGPPAPHQRTAPP